MVHVKEASRRWMYRGRRRNQMARLLNRVDATVAATGIGPKRMVRLEVRGRRTGRRLSFPVVIAEYKGSGISWRCSARRRTGCATSARLTAEQCWGMVGARTSFSKRSIRANVLRSCDATSRRLPARGPTSRSIGALRWSSSSRSPTNTPCFGSATEWAGSTNTVTDLALAVRGCRDIAAELCGKQRPPGLSVAVVKPGESIWSDGFGLADIEAGRECGHGVPVVLDDEAGDRDRCHAARRARQAGLG